jgi:hypothetical protein
MKKLLAILVLGAVAAGFAYASYKTTQWGGSYGYLQIEHELTFLDPNGNPVEGVELKVEDQRGNEFCCFPVTDYLPGQTPKSDKKGVIRFHHVSTAVEWDNYGWALFWCFPIQRAWLESRVPPPEPVATRLTVLNPDGTQKVVGAPPTPTWKPNTPAGNLLVGYYVWWSSLALLAATGLAGACAALRHQRRS